VSSDVSQPSRISGLALKHCLVALIVGCALGLPAARHIAGIMWGSSPYSEANAILSIDDYGHLRFWNYSGMIFRLAFALSLMLVAIPAGAFISRRKYTSAFWILTFTATCVFGVGYYWWRTIFAVSLGFPQTLSGAGPNDLASISGGWGSLSSSLALLAVSCGVVTLATALGLRFTSRNACAL
jgi:hypothetical protein